MSTINKKMGWSPARLPKEFREAIRMIIRHTSIMNLPGDHFRDAVLYKVIVI